MLVSVQEQNFTFYPLKFAFIVPLFRNAPEPALGNFRFRLLLCNFILGSSLHQQPSTLKLTYFYNHNLIIKLF